MKVEKKIMQLKQIMSRWRALARRARARARESEPGLNRPVRSGFMAVYVGPDRTRFVIPARLVNLPVFAALLELAEEEYGFQPVGGLVLPCEPGFFRRVLDALERDLARFKELGLGGFISLFAESDRSTSYCECEELDRSHLLHSNLDLA